MTYGICPLSCVPTRKEASHSSEMNSQLLFGEHYTVLKQQNSWLFIKTAYDHYECWIHSNQHRALSEKDFQQLEKQSALLCKDLVGNLISAENNREYPITMGSVLPFLNNKELRIGIERFHFEGKSTDSEIRKSKEDILKTAFSLLNAPYLWGGRSPFGIDCSGFSQLVFKLNGYKLPRDAYQQVEKGKALGFADEAEAGDLAFFDNEEGRIVHVGILINKDQIIHASGKVRIDRFDHYGIYNAELKSYSHTLRVIKSIL